jgi:hypothetical protein
MRQVALYLKDILAALDSIQAFTAGLDMVAFQEGDKTLSAVIRKFKNYRRSRQGQNNIPKCHGRRWPGCGINSSMGIPGWILLKSGW